MPPSHPLKLEPGTLVGHYTVESLISSGAFGAVYRVTRDGQSFALKVPLTRAPSDEARKVTEARIVREVVSLMSLKHPGIVGVHGFDRWPDPVGGALYLVMDFVDGRPLKRWREATSPTLREILDVFRQLALAVEAMHAMGVVHRDIKSSNVLVSLAPASSAAATTQLTRVDRGAHSTGSAVQTVVNRTGSPVYQPVLVDFGLARPTFTADVTAEHVVVGTEGALAPELLASSGKHFHYTPATDLYALGRLFFEVLTGIADPYNPATSFCGRNLRVPSIVARGLSSRVDTIVLDLLAEDPARRTPSAAELARQLEAMLADDSWGDALPVPASFILGKGHNLHGRFITRAEGQDSPGAETIERPPESHTAEPEGVPTLPMFVLDSIDTLAGVEAKPPLPVGAPYPVAAPHPVDDLRCRRRLDAVVSFAGRWLKRAANVVTVFLLGMLAWMAVIAILSVVFPPPPGGLTVIDPSDFLPRPTEPSAPDVAPPTPSPEKESNATIPEPRTRIGSLPAAPTRTRPQPMMVRAALVGHAQPGPARAVLRQPVQLATASLPTGAALEGTASPLPDGRFLLRFDAAPRPNGSRLPLSATSVVGAAAGARRPLTPGLPRDGFEFDVSFAAGPQ